LAPQIFGWLRHSVQVQKVNMLQLFNENCRNIYPIIQSKSGPDHRYLKRFTDRIQYNFNKIRLQFAPSPIQVQSNAHLLIRAINYLLNRLNQRWETWKS